MTKEECIALLNRYAEYNGIGIPNLAGCREAMRTAAELLQQPSLPSNLNEAAEEYAADLHFSLSAAFIAGAEWMARQGETREIQE